MDKKLKVALVAICLNPPYWQYLSPMIESAKRFFLINHDVDYLLWSDVPEVSQLPEILPHFSSQADIDQARTISPDSVRPDMVSREYVEEYVTKIRSLPNVTIFPTEPVQWPMPTLMRYHLFLQQEEVLKNYDYVFYCDADMLFVDTVDEEILGEDLTAAQHPMYALDKRYIPPYEPNPNSKAYIPRPGRVIMENGMPRFLPLYFAGGFQGGKTGPFIEAMKGMKKAIDQDFVSNYTAIWNDESHWNRYLFDHPPSVVLTPSYVYPDSLINEYYIKIWGTNYPPKLVTLTKRHTTSKEGGEQLRKMLENQ